MLCVKPTNEEIIAAVQNWDKSVAMLAKPKTNKYVPTNTNILGGKPRLELNRNPDTIELGNKKKKVILYHCLDQVWLKPKTCIDIIMRIKQPIVRTHDNSKQI